LTRHADSWNAPLPISLTGLSFVYTIPGMTAAYKAQSFQTTTLCLSQLVLMLDSAFNIKHLLHLRLLSLLFHAVSFSNFNAQ